MGEPIDCEIEYGNDCGMCTPGTWAVGKTPKYLEIVFTGINICAGGVLPDLKLILKQDLAHPCLWETDGTWYAKFEINGGGTTVWLRDHSLPIDPFWFSRSVARCTFANIPNGLVCGVAILGEGGFANIDPTGSLSPAGIVLCEYNLFNVSPTKTVPMEIEAPTFVHRFENYKVPASILVKVNHEDF